MLNTVLGKKDPFTSATLTDIINHRTKVWGVLKNSGIFSAKTLATTIVKVVKQDGQAVLIPAKARGDNATQLTGDKKSAGFFEMFHHPVETFILPDDLQNVSALADNERLITVEEIVAERLKTISESVDITHEHALANALQGMLIDENGELLIDYYKELDFTKKTISLKLDSADTIVRKEATKIGAYYEEKATGVLYTRAVGYLGADLWDALVNHQNVIDTYKQSQHAHERLGSDLSVEGFEFGGVLWHPYRANYSGTSFIAKNSGVVIPTGGSNLFKVYYGPANLMSHVNKLGKEIAIHREDKETHTKLHGETNFIAIPTRPDLSVHVTLK